MNNQLNPLMTQIAEKVLGEGLDAAQRFIDEVLERKLQEAKLMYEAAQNDVVSARQLIALMRNPLLGGLATPVAAPPAPPTRDDEPRTVILDTAVLLASGNSQGVVTTEDVVAMLAKRGVGIVGKRPGTSVGNVLFRHPEWERVGEGAFRLKRPEAG